MAEYFDDETDPSKGKLYINYPMMESYRDSDSFYDNQFVYNTIALSDIPSYKSIVSHKRLSGYDINEYSKENYTDLMRMHVNKLAYLSEKSDYKNLAYSEYLSLSSEEKIAAVQKKCIAERSYIHVINTSLFFLLDYYGNRDGFYDSVVLME